MNNMGFNKIYYLGHYDSDDNSDERYFSLAGRDKMKYIAESICSLGYEVEIISASKTVSKKNAPKKYIKIDDKINLKLFSSIGKKTILHKIIDVIFIQLQLFFYLFKTLKKGDILFVYHSLNYMRTIELISKIKKIVLILEMEEIYSDVSGNLKGHQREVAYSTLFDAYIFPTKLLDDKINKTNKESIIIHGVYASVNKKKKKCKKDKIHVVYAGTLDPRKGGAFASIEASKFLNERYHMHILGFGTNEEIKNIKDYISSLKSDITCELTFDGCLFGDDYTKFIQMCDIGLSTQNPNGVYNDTSFPSKILSYLSNGLRVVSINIPVVLTSNVNDMINFYDNQTPKDIANAILSVNTNTLFDSHSKIKELDEKFKASIDILLEELKYD